MPRPIERSARADRDLLDHYAFIHGRDPEAGERLFDAVWATFQVIAEHPRAGRLWRSPNRKLNGIRVIPLARPFEKYLVFYHGGRRRVQVIAVLHAARDLLALLG
jgi:plasmid stabilization system protein ParE